jgi:hypothetical protein
VRDRVVESSTRAWSGATPPPSDAVLALLEAGGFVREPPPSNTWVRGTAVRVPWALMSGVEGVVEAGASRDAAGAVTVVVVVDSPAFPRSLRPLRYGATGAHAIPVPGFGVAALGCELGFFVYVDVSNSEDAPLTFDVRLGGQFKLAVGVSLLPASLATPFPDPLVSVLRHDFGGGGCGGWRGRGRGGRAGGAGL